MITDEQVQHFQTFGFVVLREVLTPQEIEAVHREFELGLEEFKSTQRGGGARNQLNWSNVRPDMPFITGLLEDDRFVERAERLLGQNAIGFDSVSSHFAGDHSPWHPDTELKHLIGFKFGFYLQPIDGESGALRVLPGSHKSPYYDNLFDILWPNGDSSGRNVDVRDAPAFVCVSNPGDAVVFNYQVWHGTWGGSTDRRMVAMQFQKCPETAEEEAAVRSHVAGHRTMMEEFGWEASHHPEWVANPGGSKRRQRWITKLREMGYIDN